MARTRGLEQGGLTHVIRLKSALRMMWGPSPLGVPLLSFPWQWATARFAGSARIWPDQAPLGVVPTFMPVVPTLVG